MSKKVRLFMRMDEKLVKLVDGIAEKIGEDRTDFTRSAWLLRINELKKSSILSSIDKIENEMNEEVMEGA